MTSEKIIKMRQTKGITLLALVITIVILIILALVAISFAFGENGVVKYADKAKLEAEIDSARERLSLVLGSAYTEKKTSTKYESEEDFLDNYLDDYIKQRETEASIFNEDGVDYISLNGYIFELDRSVPQLGDYDGTEENRPPKIRNIDRVETDNPYSELSIEVTAARAKGATFKYSIKKEGEEYSSPVEGENTYLFTNLESKVKYTVKVELVMNGKIVDTKEETVILGLLEAEDLEFGEITWNSGKASITVSTATNKQIQYMIVPEGSGLTNWIDISNNGSITNIPNGALVSARLWDGKNASEEISRTIVDKTAPIITKFEVTETTYNSIAVQVEAEDNESGIASADTYKFYLNDEIEEKGTSTDGRYKFDGLNTSETETSYKVRVEVYDNAGNKSEKIIENVNTKAVIMKIQTKEDMEEFRDIVNSGYTYEGKTVELMNDIDLQGDEGNQWIPVGTYSRDYEIKFNGIFKGNGNTIKNIYINQPEDYVALFGNIDVNAEIKNLVVDGQIKGKGAAGVVFRLNGKVINCINKATISGDDAAGGIVASMNSSSLPTTLGCANFGSISSWEGGTAGGIVSGGAGTVKNCYNMGNVEGRYNIGGILGLNITEKLELSNCYNVGSVSGSNGGGIVGVLGRECSNSKIINSLNSGIVNGISPESSSNIIGSCEGNSSYSNCFSISQNNFKSYSNEEIGDTLGSEFLKDVNNINDGYPILKWQLENQE